MIFSIHISMGTCVYVTLFYSGLKKKRPHITPGWTATCGQPSHFSHPRALPHPPSFAVDYLKTSQRIVSSSRGLYLIILITMRAVGEREGLREEAQWLQCGC